MFLFILGILDIIAGILLWLGSASPFTGSIWLIAFGIFFTLKGLWSILSSTAAGFYFDVLGALDFVAGIFLFLSSQGMTWGFLLYLGILMLIKGLYSFGIGIASGG